MKRPVACWCGHTDLEPFSPDYLRCPACETLVYAQMPDPTIARVTDDAHDFYGREYWLSYQEKVLGYADITVRARTDLPERCLYWLRAFLKYRLPPGRVLELGSGHGGFVALLRWAGFDAVGLELSPWVVDFARRTFDVPMLLGPVEDQALATGSLDGIVLMDVLEHLPDPVGTIQHCLRLLKPDGIFLIQTPRYPEGKTYPEMVEQKDPFLEQLKPKEHLYLFSMTSIQTFFRRLGVEDIRFEPPIFAHYDMFLVASRSPIRSHTAEAIEQTLSRTPTGRMVLALWDLDRQYRDLYARYMDVEADRAARLEVIQRQAEELGRLQGEHAELQARLQETQAYLAHVEADRAARLEVIQRQAEELGRLQGEHAELQARLQETQAYLAHVEADRAARLEVIQRQAEELGRLQGEHAELQARLQETQAYLAHVEADRAARLEVIQRQAALIQDLQDRLKRAEILLQRALTLRSSRLYYVARRVGRWRWVERLLQDIEALLASNHPKGEGVPSGDGDHGGDSRGEGSSH